MGLPFYEMMADRLFLLAHTATATVTTATRAPRLATSTEITMKATLTFSMIHQLLEIKSTSSSCRLSDGDYNAGVSKPPTYSASFLEVDQVEV